MLRRSFLSLLPAASAVAEVSILPPPTLSTIDLLMQLEDRQVAQLNLPTGVWDVMWTGWKDRMETLEHAGQWAARRAADNEWPYKHWFVYVSVPGGWGAIRFGEAVDTACRFPQMYPAWWRDKGDLEYDQKSEAARAFLELITVSDWKVNPNPSAPLPRIAANQRAFDRVSPRTKFYLDSSKFSENDWGVSDLQRAKAREFGFRIDE